MTQIEREGIIRKKDKVYDYDSLFWLSKNYIWKRGLRTWTWRIIIEGIIEEHTKTLVLEFKSTNIDMVHIELIWHTFLKVAGIKNLNSVPVTNDPKHPDV